MGFFKKGKKDEIIPFKRSLQEAPLGYWEEKSYMMVIPENEGDLANLNDIIGRISDIPGITVMKKWADNKSQVFRMNIKYDNEEYQIGLFPGRFSLPRVLINSSSYSSSSSFGISGSASSKLFFASSDSSLSK